MISIGAYGYEIKSASLFRKEKTTSKFGDIKDSLFPKIFYL